MSKVFSVRLENEEIEELHKIAISFNCTYGGKPAFGQVLKEIAKGNYIISQKIVAKSEDTLL